jgi:hypothetical protein
MKPGKLLEITLRIVQESLKDNPDTEIFTNYKIRNRSGRLREFDLAIKAQVNKFNILTVIECKDYKHPVSVEKIEAFHSKCERIPEINKLVFVSRNGFQPDAINAAKDFGIEIYNIENLDINTIANWLSISMLTPVRVQLKLNNIEIQCHEPISSSDFSYNSILCTEDSQFTSSIKEFAHRLIKDSGLVHKKLFFRHESEEISRTENYIIELNSEKNLLIADNKNLKHKIKGLKVRCSITTFEVPKKVSVDRIISENTEMATVITHDTEGPDQFQLVIKDGNPDEFIPFMINKDTGAVIDLGVTLKYEKVR